MDQKFSLNSQIHWEGVFWDRGKPDEQFAGTLSSDGRHLELITRAELVKPDLSFLEPNRASAPDIVHGYTSAGDCTVIGLREIENPGLLDFGSGRGLRWHRFRVTGACVTGWHLPSDAAEVLTSADCTYSGINQWLPGCGGLVFTEDAITVSFPKKRPIVLDLCVLSNPRTCVYPDRSQLSVSFRWKRLQRFQRAGHNTPTNGAKVVAVVH